MLTLAWALTCVADPLIARVMREDLGLRLRDVPKTR